MRLKAYETYVGWTAEGKVSNHKSHNIVVKSLLLNSSLTELWQPDVLGIPGPTKNWKPQ